MAKENINDFQLENVNSDYLFDIFVDAQNRLHIISKTQKPTLPKYIPVSKMPNIEMFMPSLEKELAEKDITEEERAQMAAAEQARIEEEQRAKEEAERKAREEAEAKAKAEEEARLAAEAAKKEEEERLARELAEKEEAERLAREEAERKAEEEARLAAEAAQKEEEERLAREQAEKEEAERLAREQAEKEEAERLAREEAERKAEEAARSNTPTPSSEKISVISFDTLKGKKKPLVSKSAMQQGGIAAAKAEARKQQNEINAIRKEEAQERAAQRKAEKEQEEISRLPNAILIGNTKKPSPEFGKFEIVATKDAEKPFKFVLKTEAGKVVFETSPMKTKPNELTAVMFKNIMTTGSFTFTRSMTGIIFKILDSRQRVFYTSRSYMSVQDAQRAAALIKKYGLSANYIDDTTI